MTHILYAYIVKDFYLFCFRVSQFAIDINWMMTYRRDQIKNIFDFCDTDVTSINNLSIEWFCCFGPNAK